MKRGSSACVPAGGKCPWGQPLPPTAGGRSWSLWKRAPQCWTCCAHESAPVVRVMQKQRDKGNMSRGSGGKSRRSIRLWPPGPVAAHGGRAGARRLHWAAGAGGSPGEPAARAHPHGFTLKNPASRARACSSQARNGCGLVSGIAAKCSSAHRSSTVLGVPGCPPLHTCGT